MQNGRGIVYVSLLLTFFLSLTTTYSQSKDTSRFATASYKVDDECKSKSERMPKPIVLKIARQKLSAIKLVKELIPGLPTGCEVLCVFVSIKKADDKVFEFLNIGNEMVYADRLVEGKFIMIENLATTCYQFHKANYKILIE